MQPGCNSYTILLQQKLKMDMAHHHEHHHEISSLNGIYTLSLVLNLAFVFIEAGVGIWKDSVGLLSDAGHNLSDVFSLLLAMFAFKLSASHSRPRFTYGLRKSSVLISLLNAVILLVVVGAIIVESIHRFMNPVPVDGGAVAWTAGAGIVVNGLTALLLMHHQEHDINTRGAFLHMLADTLVSVGVLASGLVIRFTGWNVIDPIISLVIAVVILWSTWELLHESVLMSIDGVPESIDTEKVENCLSTATGVLGFHHLHIWPISTTETALTVHILVNDMNSAPLIIREIEHELGHLGIGHVTIQAETEECPAQHCC